MGVRKTESRIPQGFTADSLGMKAVSTSSANVILVSYFSSPVEVRRIQRYVVFVIDTVIAGTVNSYEWSFNNGTTTNQTTTIGVSEFTPQNTGSLIVTCVIKNATNVTLHTITLTQQVISLNNELELRIEQTENNFPGAAHPETSRELINDIRPYINLLLPIATNGIYNKAISSLVYANSLALDQVRRNVLLEDLANIINTTPSNFYSQAKNGIGIAKTRPQLLAMVLDNPAATGTKYLDITALELVAGATETQRTANATAIETAFNALSVDIQTDLYNLLRFPKSHVEMAKRIFDLLGDRYYNGTALELIFGNSDKAKRLITAYEKGPIALGSGRSLLSSTTYANRVFGLFNNAVWTVAITAISGAPAAGAGGGITTAATVGIPEKLPSHTFIADSATEAGFGATSVGYLRKAFIVHDSFGLNPQITSSFQDLITTLSGISGNLDRLRLVTHFGGQSTGGTLSGNGVMFLPFFTDQRDFNGNIDNRTEAFHFEYGVDDNHGLKALYEAKIFPFYDPDFLSRGTVNGSTVYERVLSQLQSTTDASLTPFNLQAPHTPSTNVLNIIKWASSLLLLNRGTTLRVKATVPLNMSERDVPSIINDACILFIQNKINSFITTSGVTVASNVNNLNTAIQNLTLADIGIASIQAGPDDVPSMYLQGHSAMRTELNAVKTKLNNAFVDIRGCRVGQDRPFMQALRGFFGNSGTEPTISAPEWYQIFGNIGYRSDSTGSGLDAFFNSGISDLNITASDVQRDYSAWAGRVGINSQISFWNNLMNGNTFDLISLTWKTLLPPIGMVSETLTTLATQQYADSIASLKKIFRIDANSVPIPADCTTFETTNFPQITTLLGIQTAVNALTDASTTAELQAQLTALSTLATSNSTTLPATPASITKAHIQACIDAIKLRLVAISNINTLITAIKAKLVDPKVGYRYMMEIGLPIIIQSASREANTYLIFNEDLKTNALKAFKRINFEAPFPSATEIAINSISPVAGEDAVDRHNVDDLNDDTFTETGKGLAYSKVAINHQMTETAVNPSEEFHEHIKTNP